MTSMTIKSCQNQYYLFGPLLNLIMATNIPGNYGTEKERDLPNLPLDDHFSEKGYKEEHNHKDTVRWAGDHKP
ncbi:hypothetical protein RCL_jg10374.t1 [Rhizophagus clarus]|uniref:Uncharacterized protein n=1 Tax=Rhizophagus clarus TaxID=94130 RepID=A0A8H3QD39_9GLOM|nr:hypothetical protein RCL_jg10374.t1 [Rhizophagus clarus]